MIPALEVCAAGFVTSAGFSNQSRGVASSAKIGTGVYELTLQHALPDFGTVVVLTPLSIPSRNCTFELVGQTIVRVRVFDGAGGIADSDVSFIVYQVPGTLGES